ncbi:hypothetical protein ALC60_09468 [Trachymyrmex zeteki]|uniref:Uncharacterized protein n=1 Tax=Mycetomoellerius zeteki TaxID=64791 RepID=A0A151WU74_9HYME|nr:hypothetical protein ALC60_09468 [Trachymyrmex zeteki]
MLHTPPAATSRLQQGDRGISATCTVRPYIKHGYAIATARAHTCVCMYMCVNTRMCVYVCIHRYMHSQSVLISQTRHRFLSREAQPLFATTLNIDVSYGNFFFCSHIHIYIYDLIS